MPGSRIHNPSADDFITADGSLWPAGEEREVILRNDPFTTAAVTRGRLVNITAEINAPTVVATIEEGSS